MAALQTEIIVSRALVSRLTLSITAEGDRARTALEGKTDRVFGCLLRE